VLESRPLRLRVEGRGTVTGVRTVDADADALALTG
jgi:hypothetical protein